MDMRLTIAQALSPLCGVDCAELSEWIEVPKNTELGDYAFPCFRLARTLKKAPPVIAHEL